MAKDAIKMTVSYDTAIHNGIDSNHFTMYGESASDAMQHKFLKLLSVKSTTNQPRFKPQNIQYTNEIWVAAIKKAIRIGIQRLFLIAKDSEIQF